MLTHDKSHDDEAEAEKLMKTKRCELIQHVDTKRYKKFEISGSKSSFLSKLSLSNLWLD